MEYSSEVQRYSYDIASITHIRIPMNTLDRSKKSNFPVVLPFALIYANNFKHAIPTLDRKRRVEAVSCGRL